MSLLTLMKLYPNLESKSVLLLKINNKHEFCWKRNSSYLGNKTNFKKKTLNVLKILKI